MPSSIQCRVTDCSYNGNETCGKQDVYVSGSDAGRQEDTACKSFVRGSGLGRIQANAMSSSGGSAFSNGASVQTAVACNVSNCAYNTGNMCNRSEISIDSLTAPGNCMRPDQTCCHSFQER